jgi:hypothetical protein
MSKQPAGPSLDASLSLLRAIVSDWWDDTHGRPRAAAFNFGCFSVNVHRSDDSLRWFAQRLPRTVEVVSFNVDRANSLGYDCRDEPDENYPENPDHAHVYNPNPHSKRKARAQQLALSCQRVERFHELKAQPQ